MSLSMSLTQIAELLGVNTDVEALVTGATQDSRKVQAGNLYLAFVGERVDGHDYIAEARENGATAALVSRRVDDVLPQLLVDDVLSAFGEIAKAWLAKCQAKVVAITGSNGKTTLKEMVTAILSQVGQVTATKGNYNNSLGVPLTVCQINQDDDFAVLEMGASHLGDIQELVEIAMPDVAIVNNVAPAHIEGFGSIEGVADTKGAIYSGLKQSGIAIVNADMPYQVLWAPMIGQREKLTFGLDAPADVTASYMQLEAASSHFMVVLDEVNHHFTLPLPGQHNVNNALAAIAITSALKVPVSAMVKGLQNMRSVAHRLQLRQGLQAARLIDDTYNANPASYTQALSVLTHFGGEPWLVLADFGELGEEANSIHQNMGQQAKAAGVKRLFTLGEMTTLTSETFGEGAMHFNDMTQLASVLKTELNPNVTCLFKGSRYMQLDRLVDQLVTEGEH